MEIVSGKITNYDERAGGFSIFVPYNNIDRLCLREYQNVEVGFPDGRTITPVQRRKAYAIMQEIGEWQGELTKTIKQLLKIEFVTNRMEALQKRMFSLSDCDVTLAKEFISFLIDFVVEYGVPTRVPILELCEDIGRAVYACLMNKKCILCGIKGELHHVDAIGMGNDRSSIYQIGMRVVSLCRNHHTEAHTKGLNWLLDDMHIVPIALTKEIGKVYGLTKKNLASSGEISAQEKGETQC